MGRAVHDVITGVGLDPDAPGIPDLDDGPVRRWLHRTNAAGGLTGGISNGEPIVVRGAVKPISTLARPLPSADLRTGQPVDVAHYERSDISVVPAAGVIGEAMVLLTLTRFVLEKFGGDSLLEVRDNLARYRERTLALVDADDRRRGTGSRWRGRVRLRRGRLRPPWTWCWSAHPGAARAPSVAAWRARREPPSSTSTRPSRQAAGTSVARIFETEGEAGFRARERAAVEGLGGRRIQRHGRRASWRPVAARSSTHGTAGGSTGAGAPSA